MQCVQSVQCILQCVQRACSVKCAVFTTVFTSVQSVEGDYSALSAYLWPHTDSLSAAAHYHHHPHHYCHHCHLTIISLGENSRTFSFSSGGVVWECHEHRVMEEALHWSDRFRLRWYYHGGEGG